MKKLGTILEEAGVIDEIQLIRALSHQRKWRCRLGKSFVELGIVSEETIAKTVAQQLGIPYKEFDPKATPQELLELIPQDFAQTKMFFPLGYYSLPEGNAVEIAMSDPTDEETLIKLEKAVGIRIWRVVARDSEIERAVGDWEKLKSSCARSPNAEELIESVKIKDETASSKSEFKSVHDEREVEKEWQEVSEPSVEEKIMDTLPPPPPPVQMRKESFPDATESMSNEEILSVAGLPPIEEDISSPTLEEPEPPSLDARPLEEEASPNTEMEPQETVPVFQSSQMWEETMPSGAPQAEASSESVPLENAEGISPAPEGVQVIEHTQAWEHIMPGTDVGAVEPQVEELSPPVVEPAPSPPQVAQGVENEPQASQQLAPENLLEEINQLKAQINLIRKEVKILKEALVKIKRGEI